MFFPLRAGCRDGEQNGHGAAASPDQVRGGGGRDCGQDVYAHLLHDGQLPRGVRAHSVSAVCVASRSDVLNSTVLTTSDNLKIPYPPLYKMHHFCPEIEYQNVGCTLCMGHDVSMRPGTRKSRPNFGCVFHLDATCTLVNTVFVYSNWPRFVWETDELVWASQHPLAVSSPHNNNASLSLQL